MVDILKIQDQHAFIPFIGNEYDSGVNEEKEKVLIIGPRHYCDAMNDSRNLIPSLIKVIKEGKMPTKVIEDGKMSKTILKKNITLTNDIERIDKTNVTLKIGCLKGSAADCLMKSYGDEPFICPVFEDQQCVLPKDVCEYSGKVNCNGIRQLRCETLIAIYDYLHSNEIQKTVYQILSAEHGHSYFNSITQYLKRRFKIEDSPWKKVAFMNLLQRYVPYRGMEEINLYNYTKNTDVFFTLDIIKELSPTYIIATTKYVADELLGKKEERKDKENSQKWFKDKYEIIEDENGFILLKVKGKDARVLLSNLKSESVFNGFLRFYKELDKPSLRILVCTFLYYSNRYFQEKYKEYNINMSMISN